MFLPDNLPARIILLRFLEENIPCVQVTEFVDGLIALTDRFNTAAKYYRLPVEAHRKGDFLFLVNTAKTSWNLIKSQCLV